MCVSVVMIAKAIAWHQWKSSPNMVAAISVGLSREGALLDLNYEEDSSIGTDMNFVMNDKNEFIEMQGTAEQGSFSVTQLNGMIELAQHGCQQLFQEQRKYLKL